MSRFRVAPPSADDCPICELPLDGRLFRTRRGWVHWTCRLSEKE